MITLKLNRNQARAIYGQLEKLSYEIYDDPSVYLDEDDFESVTEMEQELDKIKKDLVDDVLEQLK